MMHLLRSSVPNKDNADQIYPAWEYYPLFMFEKVSTSLFHPLQKEIHSGVIKHILSEILIARKKSLHGILLRNNRVTSSKRQLFSNFRFDRHPGKWKRVKDSRTGERKAFEIESKDCSLVSFSKTPSGISFHRWNISPISALHTYTAQRLRSLTTTA